MRHEPCAPILRPGARGQGCASALLDPKLNSPSPEQLALSAAKGRGGQGVRTRRGAILGVGSALWVQKMNQKVARRTLALA